MHGITYGISLYSYLYLNIAKTSCFFLLSFMLFLLQNQRIRGQGVGGYVTQIMYADGSKCKKNETKFKTIKI
jgi:hypothetical protein